MLPLPPVSDAELTARPVSTDVLRLLEAALVTWTRQIKAVLGQEPESAASAADGTPAGPLAELDYWSDRATQLAGIWKQLGQPGMQRAMAALEAGASTYLPAFVRLCREVDAAQQVAAESSRYLQPLRKPLDRLHSMDDFPALACLFKPILHTLLLIWQHSQHYSSAPRLVSLVRHICNDLISQARRFCPGAVAVGAGLGWLVYARGGGLHWQAHSRVEAGWEVLTRHIECKPCPCRPPTSRPARSPPAQGLSSCSKSRRRQLRSCASCSKCWAPSRVTSWSTRRAARCRCPPTRGACRAAPCLGAWTHSWRDAKTCGSCAAPARRCAAEDMVVQRCVAGGLPQRGQEGLARPLLHCL